MDLEKELSSMDRITQTQVSDVRLSNHSDGMNLREYLFILN